MPAPGNYDTEYPMLLELENKIKLLEPFKGSKAHHRMQCMMCNHIWSATPLSKRQTLKKNGVSGCPSCNQQRKDGKYAKHRSNVIQALRTRGIEILDPTYDGRLRLDYTKPLKEEKILVRNTNCGHEFLVTPLNLVQSNVECGVCGPLRRVAPLTAWSKLNSAKWRETATEWQKYKATVSSLTTQTYRKYKHIINPNNLPRGNAGVVGAYHLDHIVPKRFCFDNNIPPEVCADKNNLQMIGWRENVGARDRIKGAVPPLFLQYISTGTKLETYANQLIDIFPNATKFCAVGDIVATVYDENTNHAIVVIPIDAHHANQKIALTTSRALSQLQINHTILFEDELANATLLHAKLKHYTNNSTSQRIHARDCVIRPCTKEEKKRLLVNNHVQGNDSAPVYYGAYFDEQLVAVMTFSPPRVALGQKNKGDKEGVWELSRFCTDVNFRIPGIASKLLTHFKRNHEWTEIYSYADKRWSVGNMYHQLGFTLTADNPPDYFYVIGGQRKHRWNYRKDILKNTLPNYDPSLTEYQNMENHGYWRVWDCGTLKFSMINRS